MMNDVREITARFPLREYEIYRLCLQSARFKAICADYELAATALRRWQHIERETGGGEQSREKSHEYNMFLQELAHEILEELDRARPSATELGESSSSEDNAGNEPQKHPACRGA